MRIEAARATPTEIQRYRRALQEAVLDDFIDDFPDPTHPADVAKRLYLSHALVRYHVTTGDLVGTFRDGRWYLNVRASRSWIAAALATRTSRRLGLRKPVEESRAVTVDIREPAALRRLRDMQVSGLTHRDIVEQALRSLGQRDDAVRVLRVDDRTSIA